MSLGVKGECSGDIEGVYCGNEGVSWHLVYDGHTLRDAVMQAESHWS